MGCGWSATGGGHPPNLRCTRDDTDTIELRRGEENCGGMNNGTANSTEKTFFCTTGGNFDLLLQDNKEGRCGPSFTTASIWMARIGTQPFATNNI